MDELAIRSREKLRNTFKERGTTSFKWGIIGILGFLVPEILHWTVDWPSHPATVYGWIIGISLVGILYNVAEIYVKWIMTIIEEFRERIAALNNRIEELEKHVESSARV